MISIIRRYVNIKKIIFIIIVLCFINNRFLTNKKVETQNNLESSQIQEITNSLEENNLITQELNENIEKQAETTNNTKIIWQVEIPSINLKALIAEGTSKEIMDEYVGHFEETVKKGGNIGLAAHNRGYKVNYFQDLKKLKEGDEIIYKYKEFEKRYVVKTLKIINDDDWSMLENTEDNRITLITCVENEPQYRRVVQAIEKNANN